MRRNASPVVPTVESCAHAAAPSPACSQAPSTGRLIGIDLARGLAVFGMFSVHVGPDVTVGGPVGFLLETARGRCSPQFARLHRFTLIKNTRPPRAPTGRPRPRPR
ncbi:hypothetical protein ACFW2E_21490, partial [Streptomyces sp. NPDC058964]